LDWFTPFITIISGVVIFILGQLFIEYFLKPLQRYKQLRAKAAYCLTYYANKYDASYDDSKDTSIKYRELAAELEAFSIEKPIIVFTIRRNRLKNSSSCFIGLSNSVTVAPDFGNIIRTTREVKQILRLD
jgi:hypothetical protein